MSPIELEKLVKSDIEKDCVDAHYADFKETTDDSKKGKSKNSK